jgi:Pyruvate/2-oxoacid:ferredoxin oxidoreductase gamma subunit
MVALGALVAATGVLSLSTVVQALRYHLAASKAELLALNEQALQRGAHLVESIKV